MMALASPDAETAAMTLQTITPPRLTTIKTNETPLEYNHLPRHGGILCAGGHMALP